MLLWSTLGPALVGGAIGTALRIPAGAMVGALLLMASANLLADALD